MIFSDIRNDLENASYRNEAESERCRQFWPDEGGANFVEYVLGGIKNNLSQMAEKTQSAVEQQMRNEQICQDVDSYAASAQSRDTVQEASNNQLKSEAETLLAKCHSTLETAKKIEEDSRIWLWSEVSSLQGKVNSVYV